MKKGILAALIISLLLTLVGCGCEHEWSEATCTEAPVCTKCGETEGEALGHVWEAATCTEAETCKSCGASQGEALGHTPGSWEYDGEVDCVSGTQSASLLCASCGAVVETKAEPLTSMVKDGSFLFTGEEFTERISHNLLEVVGSELIAKYSEDGYNGEPLCQILSPSGDELCKITFDDRSFSSVEHGSRSIASIDCTFRDLGNTDYVTQIMLGIVLSCDPTLSLEDAQEAAGEILSYELYKQNGLQFWYYIIAPTNVNRIGVLSISIKD